MCVGDADAAEDGERLQEVLVVLGERQAVELVHQLRGGEGGTADTRSGTVTQVGVRCDILIWGSRYTTQTGKFRNWMYVYIGSCFRFCLNPQFDKQVGMGLGTAVIISIARK